MELKVRGRHPDVWGSNPHAFEPERWLDGRIKRVVSIGLYNNL
jgi:cytochrome P450